MKRIAHLVLTIALLIALLVQPMGALASGVNSASAAQLAPLMLKGAEPAQAGGVQAAQPHSLPAAGGEATMAADAQNVEFVGQIGGATYAVAVQGGYAYIGVGPRLVVLDVINPASPVEVGKTHLLPDIVQDVVVAGDYAYVAAGDGGLRVVDVSDPAHPTEVGAYGTPGYGVAVAGSTAYVAAGEAGLRVVEVSDRTAPREVGSCDAPGYGVALAGQYAYVTDYYHGLRVVDVSEPAAPCEVGSYKETVGLVYDVAVAGRYAYVAATGAGLRVLDVSDPAVPRKVGSCDTVGVAFGVAVVGNYAYVADEFGGLRVVDVSVPATPRKVGSCETPGAASRVAVAGNHAYVAVGGGGSLRVVDISNPVTPREVGSYDTPGSVETVAAAGHYAYIANTGNGGLRVVDISHPAAPYEIGSYDTPGWANGVAVAGTYAYVADRYAGLRVVDVSHPPAPREVGCCDTSPEPEGAVDVAVAGNYAYVADGYAGIRVVDVSNPAHPTIVGSCDTPGGTWRVAVAGGYAYVIDGDTGLQVVDISDPAHPTIVGSWATPGDAREVAVAGGYTYLADGNGLRVVDVSNPAHPTEVGFYDKPGIARGVAVSGAYACVADEETGLRVVDVSDPSHPTEVGFYDTLGGAYDVAVAGGYAYVADGEGGLLVLRFTRALTPLTEKVQHAAAQTNHILDQVLAEAHRIAVDGDYFAVQKTEDEIKLISEAIVDSAKILADGFDAVGKVRDLTKMAFPGVLGRGWGHVLDLKATHEPARDAFRDALQQQVTPVNAARAAKEFFNGPHIYYAADMADEAAEDLLTDVAVKNGLIVVLRTPLALQRRLYPAQQTLGDIYKQDVAHTRDETIAGMPSLTAEEEQAYIEDLTQREKANVVLAIAVERRALPLHLARTDREGEQENWIANFLAKHLIKGAAFLLADGPGVLAVNAGCAFWHLYQNSRQLQEDAQMMTLAVEGMGGSLNTVQRIYLNAVHGMDNIVQGIAPQIARGSIPSITNKSEGEYKLFGRWWWFERSSYSEVNISNPSPYDAVYQVIADYGNTGFLGASYQPLVAEGVKPIAGNGSDTARVSYKEDDEGVSPDEGSTIAIDLLGSTDTGTYHVTSDGTVWNPIRVTTAGMLQSVSPAQEEAPTIPYPIRTQITVDEDTLTYIPHIWVDNPFTETVVITLTQPLLAGGQVVDPGGGALVGDSLRWQMTLDAQTTVEVTHTVRYLGDAGQLVHYPEPQLEMTDLGATASVTFTGEAEPFVSQPPLSAVGVPPVEVLRGEIVTIPITVTNRLTDEAASGTVRLSLIDFRAETEVYTDAQNVTVRGGESQSANLVLNTSDVSVGDYLLVAVVESKGGQEEIFAEYLEVKPQPGIYLPLVLRNP